MAVVSEPVQCGAGEQVVAKYCGPFGESAVAGHHQRGAFIAFGDDFIQVLRALRGERLQAEIIAQQQVGGEGFAQQPGTPPRTQQAFDFLKKRPGQDSNL